MIAEIGQHAKSHELGHGVKRWREHARVYRASLESDENVGRRTGSEQREISVRGQTAFTQQSARQRVRGRTNGGDADDFSFELGHGFYLWLSHEPKGRLRGNETDDLNGQPSRRSGHHLRLSSGKIDISRREGGHLNRRCDENHL
jgi:hypothetical protein